MYNSFFFKYLKLDILFRVAGILFIQIERHFIYRVHFAFVWLYCQAKAIDSYL